MEFQRKMEAHALELEGPGAPVHGMPRAEAASRLRDAIALRARILAENPANAAGADSRGVPGDGGG